jgi:hypothetical protein
VADADNRERLRDFRIFAVLFAGTDLGCVAQHDLRLPATDAKSALLVRVDPQKPRPDVFGLDLATTAPVHVPLSSADALYALLFSDTLEALYLAPGPIALDASDAGRPFPTASALYEAAPGGTRTWQPIPKLPDEVAKHTLMPIAAGACQSDNGCVRYPPSATDPVCEIPCAFPQKPMAPDPVAPPDMPHFGSCPEGWVQSNLSEVPGATACTAPDRRNCPDGQVQFAGDGICSPFGQPCPSGEWAADLPSGRPIIYVRASPPGMSGGMGTMSAPYLRISDALLAAADDAVIALGMGTYSEGASLHGTQSLYGACSAGTIVASNATVVSAAGGHPDVEQVHVSGGAIGIYVAPGADLSLVSVEVDGAGTAISALGTIEARALWIRGAGATIAGRATITHALFSGLHGDLTIQGGATAAIDDAVFDGGASVSSRGGIDGSRIVVAHPASGGIAILAGTATLTDTVVLDAQSDGIEVTGGGSARIQRAFVDGVAGSGINVHGEPPPFCPIHAAAIAEDVVARDSNPPDTLSGGGFAVDCNASFTLTRAISIRSRVVAFHARANSRNVLSDIVAADTLDAQGTGGIGILSDTSTIVLHRGRVDGARGAGVFHIFGVGGHSRYFDLDVRSVHPPSVTTSSSAGPGYGIRIDSPSDFHATRLHIEGTESNALQVTSGNPSAVSDLSIAHATVGVAAFGADSPVPLSVTRATIETSGTGILAGQFANVALSDIALSQDSVGLVAEMPTFDRPNAAATLTLNRFLISGAMVGVQANGVVRLSEGQIATTQNAITTTNSLSSVLEALDDVVFVGDMELVSSGN